MQNAPVVDPKKTGKKTAPPFCTGSAICFTSLAGDTTGFTHDMPERAKSLAARITGTKCLEVPADCGQDGKSCCPSDFKAITDKPLPSYGTAWAGSPCNDKLDKNGAYCIGAWLAAASLMRIKLLPLLATTQRLSCVLVCCRRLVRLPGQPAAGHVQAQRTLRRCGPAMLPLQPAGHVWLELPLPRQARRGLLHAAGQVPHLSHHAVPHRGPDALLLMTVEGERERAGGALHRHG